MKRATPREIIFINTYWIGLSFMWNSLHVIILPAVLLHLVPEAFKKYLFGSIDFFRAGDRHDCATDIGLAQRPMALSLGSPASADLNWYSLRFHLPGAAWMGGWILVAGDRLPGPAINLKHGPRSCAGLAPRPDPAGTNGGSQRS